jgi:hypothetical protein
MKTLIALILSVLSFSALATTLTWGPSSGAEGYKVYIEPTPVSGAPVVTDVGNVTTYTIAPALAVGTQYEVWVTAYAAGLPDSPESNHIQWTEPAPIQTITYPNPPTSVILNFGTP